MGQAFDFKRHCGWHYSRKSSRVTADVGQSLICFLRKGLPRQGKFLLLVFILEFSILVLMFLHIIDK